MAEETTKTIRESFFEAKAVGALWDVAVSMKRGNPLPLDSNSVFQSYADLEAYAAGPVAYPGHIVAVINEDSTNLYYLDQNLAIQPVGAADNKSIAFADGKLEISGFKAADSLTLPQKQADGTIKWVTIDEIVPEDENTVTSVKAADAGLEVKLTKDTDDEKEYTVKVNVSAAEGNKITLKEDGYFVAEYDDSALTEEVGKKANSADVYTKTEANGLLDKKANASDVYTKTEADGLLGAKANSADVYTKTEADNLLIVKADASAVYTKEEANNLFGGAFHFRGEKKTYAELEALESKNTGDVYQVGDKEYAWDGEEWVELGFNIDLSDYAKKADHYTKTETDNLLNAKANAADVYSKDAADDLLDTKANASEVYTKDEADDLLDAKANSADVYTSGKVDELLSAKANSADVYTSGKVDELLSAKADATALNDYAKSADVYTKTEADGLLDKKLEADDLAPYAKTADLEPYAKTADVNAELDKKLDASKESTINAAINAKLDIASYEAEKGSFATDKELADTIGTAPTRTTGEDDKPVWSGATGIYTNIYTKDEITDLIADITGGESAADVLAALNAYKTTTDPRIKAVEDNVAALAGAQANVLEGVKINGVALEIGTDKTVDIAIGGAKLGVVKTSAADNGVAIAADGTMSVNNINANKLIQTEGEFLILDGGSASRNI